jgi:hypothetical protein
MERQWITLSDTTIAKLDDSMLLEHNSGEMHFWPLFMSEIECRVKEVSVFRI